jgi:hypothetical protein
MKKTLSKLIKSKDKFISCVGDMEAKLSSVIDFDFSIQNLAGDGLVILNNDDANVARLSSCLDFIEKNGRLTVEYHKKISI